MPHLIAYDITNNSLRAKMSKLIISYGLDRINKSVYLGTIVESALRELEAKLTQSLQQKNDPNDSLVIITVSLAAIHGMRIHGKNELDKAELAGEKTTLILWKKLVFKLLFR